MSFRYYMIHKPYGMLSQFSKTTETQPTLADLEYAFEKDVYPIGRLDKDSEGLLLLSNDKQLTDRLLNPKRQHWKHYWAQVEGQPDHEALMALQLGVIIKVNKKPYTTKPAKVQLVLPDPPMPPRNPPIRYRKNIPTTWIDLQIMEGKNRQVRRMTAKVGFPTLRLVRHQIGQLQLGALPVGGVQAFDRATLYGLLGLK